MSELLYINKLDLTAAVLIHGQDIIGAVRIMEHYSEYTYHDATSRIKDKIGMWRSLNDDLRKYGPYVVESGYDYQTRCRLMHLLYADTYTHIITLRRPSEC